MFDYGPESVFDIKYSLKTASPVESISAWNDFKINKDDLIKLQEVEKITPTQA